MDAEAISGDDESNIDADAILGLPDKILDDGPSGEELEITVAHN